MFNEARSIVRGAQSPATRPGFVVSQYSSRNAARRCVAGYQKAVASPHSAANDRDNAVETLVTQNARAFKSFD